MLYHRGAMTRNEGEKGATKSKDLVMEMSVKASEGQCGLKLI